MKVNPLKEKGKGVLIMLIVAMWVLIPIQTIHGQETLWVLDETDDLTEETLDFITNLNENVFTNQELKPQLAIEILNEMPEGYY